MGCWSHERRFKRKIFKFEVVVPYGTLPKYANYKVQNGLFLIGKFNFRFHIFKLVRQNDKVVTFKENQKKNIQI